VNSPQKRGRRGRSGGKAPERRYRGEGERFPTSGTGPLLPLAPLQDTLFPYVTTATPSSANQMEEGRIAGISLLRIGPLADVVEDIDIGVIV
jgi:hypothetical protein